MNIADHISAGIEKLQHPHSTNVSYKKLGKRFGKRFSKKYLNQREVQQGFPQTFKMNSLAAIVNGNGELGNNLRGSLTGA